MRIYISGAITGTTDYMERFSKAEAELRNLGYTVLNPAKLNVIMPEDSTHGEYMAMSFCMLDMCDAIYMLKGWENSKGACMEFRRAYKKRIDIIEE